MMNGTSSVNTNTQANQQSQLAAREQRFANGDHASRQEEYRRVTENNPGKTLADGTRMAGAGNKDPRKNGPVIFTDPKSSSDDQNTVG